MAYRIRTDKTWSDTMSDLRAEFVRWGVEKWNVKRQEGSTRLVGVTLEWFPAGANDLRTLTSEDQDRQVDNLRKLFLIVESLRLNEARGLQDQMRAFYLQLPTAPSTRDPYEVLGVRPDTPIEDIEVLYKSKARRLHPDTSTGDGEAMKELNAAIARIREERKPVP